MQLNQVIGKTSMCHTDSTHEQCPNCGRHHFNKNTNPLTKSPLQLYAELHFDGSWSFIAREKLHQLALYV